MTTLFDQTPLGPLVLPNRLVMAPMTRTRAAADGVPGPSMAEYYAQRSTAGLIIAEATTPNAVGRTYPHIPGIHDEAQIAGWRAVTSAAGGRMFLQLQHGGRVGHPETSGHWPVAPSAIPLPDDMITPHGRRPPVTPRAMTTGEIASAVADFAAAARNAVAAGFAGVEVHAANGYLLHQFLAEGTNHRTDAYGRDRTRLVVEVTAAVADAIGADRVGVRISPGFTGNGIADTEDLYPRLADAVRDVAYLHVVFADPRRPPFTELRRRFPGVVIANPALPWPGPFPADGGHAAALRLLAEGADLVSLGRGFLANPDLVTRFRTGAALNPPRPEHFMHVQGATGYTDYPALPARTDQPGRVPAA